MVNLLLACITVVGIMLVILVGDNKICQLTEEEIEKLTK